MSDAFDLGMQAFANGDPEDMNPYPSDLLHDEWADGWSTAAIAERDDSEPTEKGRKRTNLQNRAMKPQTFTIRVGDQEVRHNAILALNADEDIEVEIRPYKKHRSVEQNKLQRKWLLEAEAQGDQTAEEYRGYCKLHFGCAILYHEDAEFAAAFDAVIRPLSYENKLRAMMIPLDMPVTRRMNTKQNAKYLDDMYQFFRGLGFILTDPMPEQLRGVG